MLNWLTSRWARNRRRAIFTVVRDEQVFLPIWLAYYGRHFAARDIYVFDHGTTDGSVEAARARFAFRHERVDHPAFNDFPWYTAFVQERQRSLLASYDVVAFAEADEILWHPRGLGRFMADLEPVAIRATGWNIWHDRQHEAAYAPGRPILAQRRYWVRNAEYDKPLIARVPLTYEFGFHTADECEATDPDLLLLHLQTMDYDVALRKRERTRAYQDYAPEALRRGFGFQGRLVGDDHAAWFDAFAADGRRQPIPDHLRRAQPV